MHALCICIEGFGALQAEKSQKEAAQALAAEAGRASQRAQEECSVVKQRADLLEKQMEAMREQQEARAAGEPSAHMHHHNAPPAYTRERECGQEACVCGQLVGP